MTVSAQPDTDGRDPAAAAEAAEAVRYLARIVGDPLPPPAPPSHLEGIEGLPELAMTLAAERAFAARLAEGDLSGDLSARGYLAGALKTLQANLRHLAWQASRVAEGDFSQRVDFMGEFSRAFNAMVGRLERSLAELRESERKYRQLAITDSLTGLYNLRYFFSIAEKEFRRALRHRRPVSVIMLDIDNFKAGHARDGHAGGVTVLREFARVRGDTLRGADVLARYGGEEFIVLLPGDRPPGAMAWPRSSRKMWRGASSAWKAAACTSPPVSEPAPSTPFPETGGPRPKSWNWR
jgi:diguanylate cyclase (GGDEF)-like protein